MVLNFFVFLFTEQQYRESVVQQRYRLSIEGIPRLEEESEVTDEAGYINTDSLI